MIIFCTKFELKGKKSAKIFLQKKSQKNKANKQKNNTAKL